MIFISSWKCVYCTKRLSLPSVKYKIFFTALKKHFFYSKWKEPMKLIPEIIGKHSLHFIVLMLFCPLFPYRRFRPKQNDIPFAKPMCIVDNYYVFLFVKYLNYLSASDSLKIRLRVTLHWRYIGRFLRNQNQAHLDWSKAAPGAEYKGILLSTSK